MALHGAVRGTVDLDLVVTLDEQNLTRLEQALHRLGLVSRIPINAKELAQFRLEFIEKRNLEAWSFVDPSNPRKLVDIIVTEDLSKLKTDLVDVGGFTLPVLSRNSLIAMKSRSGRPQDLADIKMLEKLRKND